MEFSKDELAELIHILQFADSEDCLSKEGHELLKRFDQEYEDKNNER